jgi:hypothetical protein
MKRFSSITILFFLSVFCVSPGVEAAETRDIFFPTDPKLSFIDSFGADRYGHAHEGIDIMGDKMTPLYAAVDGVVSYLVIPEASYGYAITLKDSDGYTYHYLHINNDTPGTDDGQGGVGYAYAPGIVPKAKVTRGQVVGYMGDSGNAENVGSHLHFEIRLPNDTPINPYPSLIMALAPGYDISQALSASPDINTDKGLVSVIDSPCVSGSLITLADSQAVYYCGADGKRYAFPNDKIYFTWYDGFVDVVTITREEMVKITLGGNVTYRPGLRLIKVRTDPKVYVVEKGGTLRWIRSAETAKTLYGEDWNQKIDDLPDAFFFDYKIGEPI